MFLILSPLLTALYSHALVTNRINIGRTHFQSRQKRQRAGPKLREFSLLINSDFFSEFFFVSIVFLETRLKR